MSEGNHQKFLRLSLELHETQDSKRADEISKMLVELNDEYFSMEPLHVVEVPKIA